MTSPRIAFIAHALRAGGGISVGKNIIRSFGKNAPNWKYFCSIPANLQYDDICMDIPHCVTSVFKGGLTTRLHYDLIHLPREVNAFCPDVVVSLQNVTLSRVSYPQLLLVHQPHLFYPIKNYGSISFKRYIKGIVQKKRFRKDLHTISMLFCQTETAIQRIREQYNYSGQVTLCPNAISEFTMRGAIGTELPWQLSPYAQKRRLFYLTRYYPHKNIEILIDLFRRYDHELKDTIVIITLSPEQDPSTKQLLERIAAYGLTKSIVNVGPLKQEELASYFTNCDALLMPTLMESFSGTYIEAMHFGLPILTSDLDFAHEICGDAAIYFDPWSPSDITRAILELDHNKQSLREKGRLHLQQYSTSWDDVARIMIDSIHKIL